MIGANSTRIDLDLLKEFGYDCDIKLAIEGQKYYYFFVPWMMSYGNNWVCWLFIMTTTRFHVWK